MKLGMVTYNLGRDWDLETLITHCEEAGFAGVELRTTHAHGVEVSLSAAERAEVKKRFLSERVEVTFSVCSEHLIELEDPQFCPRCAQETEE